MADHLANMPGRHRALRLLECLEKASPAMTHDLMIAGARPLVAVAFFGALRKHAAPPPGFDSARDLTGMVDPRITQNDVQTTTCRRGLQPWAGACNAHMKDDLERQLSIMVCDSDRAPPLTCLRPKGADPRIA